MLLCHIILQIDSPVPLNTHVNYMFLCYNMVIMLYITLLCFQNVRLLLQHLCTPTHISVTTILDFTVSHHYNILYTLTRSYHCSMLIYSNISTLQSAAAFKHSSECYRRASLQQMFCPNALISGKIALLYCNTML